MDSARLRPAARGVALTAVALLAAAAGIRLGIERGWFRAPFPAFGKTVAWWLDVPEGAYLFDVVTPGRVFRSARPDERFLHYLRDHRGVRRVVNLAGPSPAEEAARRLGMQVVSFQWRVGQLPPRREIEEVLALLDAGGPVLVHCSSGSDRTGVAVAAYRVHRDGWSPDAAVAEMRRYWHRPERHEELHRELSALLETLRSPTAPGR